MYLCKILGVLLLHNFAAGYDDYGIDDANYSDVYYAMNTFTDGNETGNRVRRFQNTPATVKTLGPDEIREVTGAIKQLFSGMGSQNPFTPYLTTERTDQTNTGNPLTPFLATEMTDASQTENHFTPYLTTDVTETTHIEEQNSSTIEYTNIETSTLNMSATKDRESSTFEYIPTDKTIMSTTDILRELSIDSKRLQKSKFKNIYRNPSLMKEAARRFQFVYPGTAKMIEEDMNITTLEPNATTIKREHLDMPRLLAIIEDLASEFETNLTRKLKDTLWNMSIPTCTTPTTEAPSTSEYDSNYTGVTVAKCFVCGLEVTGIPHQAYCADAFAGDFLPLVPVDPSAKGRISTFRKYCKYSNIRGYHWNVTRPRFIYGRWTGGCAVRWIDLSGIYTQRTCRSRLQPSVGKHFASKRMAKLEKTLWNIDNGCIISPMATLVPLSRGISLYARFHACVCTGNWCNTAVVNQPWFLYYFILLIVIFHGTGECFLCNYQRKEGIL